jgi:hypothetical protein
VVGVVLNLSISALDKTEGELTEITAATGQHRYLNSPTVDPLGIDFIRNTRSLNYLSKKIGAEAALLESLIHALEKIRIFGQGIEKALIQDTEKVEIPSSFSTSSIVIGERVEWFVELCRSFFIQSSYLEKRSTTLLQVVGSNLS